ncbi:MAG TPA: glycosyltransferase family 87 protein, partial [Gemmataceae bacterium]|nr:glycosyltransferase family 87 protein [Gemmataceae bacterium]
MAETPIARPSPLIPLAAVGLLTVFALFLAVSTNNFPDFFIYRAGAELGLRGESPYRLEPIRERVGEQFPDANPKPDAKEEVKADALVNNCGFFLPPQAIVVFAPFAAVPYSTAKVLWSLTTGLSAAAVLLLLRTFGNSPPRSLIGQLVPLFLLLNFLTIGIVFVGQTTLLCVGCVAAGQWCFERKWLVPGAVLWAIPFIKPHLALPLLPLAWYLGGWKRAAAITGVVAGLNLAGCLIAHVSPREYLEFLGASHGTVAFNLVSRNYEIASWNRLLYVMTEALGEPV